jgi:fibronectin type 3 domain-containing protein
VRLAGDAVEYLDRSAEFGERYIYAVTALGNENPVVESFFGGEREIDYADRFAPSPPTKLIALAETGRVRLLWDPSPQDDVVGYVVFRRQAGADFRRLTDEPIATVEYSDRSVESGGTYDYRVAAVDRVGNQSEPGNSVIARVP